jgi:hypothetical protein
VADFRIDDDAVEEAHWISKRQEPRIVNWGGENHSLLGI